jgi:hypothetical protein
MRMLNWINKLVGQAPDANGPTEAWLQLLRGNLAKRFAAPSSPIKWPASFIDRFIDHLATGGSTSVLTEADALQQALHAQGDEGRIYADFPLVAPEVGLRWAKLLTVVWQKNASSLALALPMGAQWPECLMLHAVGDSPSSYRGYGQKPPPSALLAATLESLLVADGLPPECVLTASFNGIITSAHWLARSYTLIVRSPDYAAAVDRHLESVRGSLATSEVQRRLHLVDMLADLEPRTLLRLGQELADFTTSTSKQVRQGVHAIVGRAPTAVIEPLRRSAVGGSPEQRLEALRRLGEIARTLADEPLAAFVQVTAAADKSRAVRELVTLKAAEAAAQADGLDDPAVALPSIDWSPETNAVAPELLAEFWQLFDTSIGESRRIRRAWQASQGRPEDDSGIPTLPPEVRKGLAAYLASPDIHPSTRGTGHVSNLMQHVRDAARHLCPRMTPVSAFKLLHWFDMINGGDHLHWLGITVFNAMHLATGRPTLIELGQILVDAKVPARTVLLSYCFNELAAQWQNEAVWPFMATHVADIDDLLMSPPRHNWNYDAARLYQAIAMLPKPPAQLVDTLFRVALGSAKTDRAAAQEALAASPGKEERLASALTDGKAEVRQLAATWLGKLRHAPSLPALEKAVAKEKNDVTKGAMLDALQALGQPVEKYIDRAAIAREAPKALAKGIPEEIAWFPWTALPIVRWADTGEGVPEDVLRWLVVQSFKQKSPEPNAVLRKLCGMMETRDRENFGQFVLEAWLAEDVRAVSPESAQTNAMRQAQQTVQSIASYPQFYQDSSYLGKSVQELYASFLPSAQIQPAGSAIASKGLLAIASACAGERAAAPTQRYLKLWYGMRAAQGKALIAMLAWIEHPSATQLMLSIGSRFRTKSFQEEATKQAQALAERKGWTLAELADRTIPSAGFDETATLELSYGARVFTARLLPDFKTELFNPEGKKIAALPEPRQDDDAEAAKDARKALSGAKKELKSIVDLQTDRLYEALCTERDWPAADWRDYLLTHPVVRHLVQRLVWTWTADDGSTQSFRPLDDGTLTSRDDDALALPDTARVRIAHDSNMPADEVLAWQQHLVDYAIKPLFTQFGKGSFKLPADRATASELKDFEGHMLETFSLRGRATKLGWSRGPTEDGGWFFSYDKRFPTLGLQAVIRFTGNGLPESNRAVALESLSFERTGASTGYGGSHKIGFDKVPAVLLSECYDDLRLIAAEGKGFDPEWQKKSEDSR